MKIKKNGKVITLTESDLKRIVGLVLKEEKEPKKEQLIYGALDRCIEEVSQEDYDDVYDWMTDVFSYAESYLMDDLDEEELDSLKFLYDDYVMDSWEGEEDDDDDDEFFK